MVRCARVAVIGTLTFWMFAAVGCFEQSSASDAGETAPDAATQAGGGAPGGDPTQACPPPPAADPDAGPPPPDLGPCNGGRLIRAGSSFVCDCSGAPQGGPFCDGEPGPDDDAGVLGSGERALSVSTYSYTTCALMESHGVRCWGDNESGNLGNGSRAGSMNPVQVKALTHVAQLDVGLLHACAVIDDGTLRCWGDNYGDMLRDGSNNDRDIPVLAQGLNDVVQVSLGESQSCVRHRDDTLECWLPSAREDLLGANGQRDVVDFEAGYFITTAWFADGSVQSWGEHKLTGDLAVAGIKRVASGYGFVCILKDDGTVRCAGWNHEGQLGIGTPSDTTQGDGQVVGLSDVVDLSAGFEHACALLKDGTLRCWGQNERGQIGDGSHDDRGAPSAVSGLDHVAEVTCGREHTCARTEDGNVYCWGGNAKGQLGDGTTRDRPAPVAVRGL